jgi:hypothetical protein
MAHRVRLRHGEMRGSVSKRPLAGVIHALPQGTLDVHTSADGYPGSMSRRERAQFTLAIAGVDCLTSCDESTLLRRKRGEFRSHGRMLPSG